MNMTSTRPYLIRAFYDWIVDNDCTPHIVVNAGGPNVDVPQEFVDGGQIVLNISMAAVQGLKLGDQAIEFQARFAGTVRHIYTPIPSILAIYAKENGRGMVFAEEEPEPSSTSLTLESNEEDDPDGEGGGKGGKRSGGRAHLTVVK